MPKALLRRILLLVLTGPLVFLPASAQAQRDKGTPPASKRSVATVIKPITPPSPSSASELSPPPALTTVQPQESLREQLCYPAWRPTDWSESPFHMCLEPEEFGWFWWRKNR